jgi:phosphoglycolate phosphatase-like HAD superfamily hydrolase
MVTSKYAEMLHYGIIPFLHPSYDTQFNVFPEGHFIRCKSPEDLKKKIDFLNENPEQYKKLFYSLQEKYLKDSYDRKPNPGMLLKAKKKFNLDMSKSVLIGDKISDIQAGKKSFVKTNILFNKNKKKYKKINKKSDQFIEINNLTEALKYL